MHKYELGWYDWSEDIDKNEFDSLFRDHEVLISALHFEEAVDIVLSNYLEYERFLLNTSLSIAVKHINNEYFRKTRIESNRLISNILAAIYNYSQYGNDRIKSITSSDVFQTERNKISHSNIVFKFMEELRNYTQHYGFPTSSITFSSSNEDIKDINYSIDSVIPLIDLNVLRNDNRFVNYNNQNESRIKLIHKIGCEKKDLSEFLRKYIDCIWGLHKNIRNNIENIVKNSNQRISEKVMSLSEHPVVCLVEYENDNIIREAWLDRSALDEYNILIKKYKFQTVSNLLVSNRHFSNDLPDI